ncbi:MAG TPA: hypothetical protein VE621_16155 [Bryobacteraceae bacterium]|jgi:hypothetical protein|nr:hypothetical protein [Bryobacteraceae bacterium]
MPNLNLIVSAATAFALVLIGGGLYEFLVVDPFWPRRPDLIQPNRGGISRKRFWIPAHTAFELLLIAALVSAWHVPGVRIWLLTALTSHAIMRIWSAFDFIPKALAFEKADSIDEEAARRWSRRSKLRLPFDVLTAVSMLAAFSAASQV